MNYLCTLKVSITTGTATASTSTIRVVCTTNTTNFKNSSPFVALPQEPIVKFVPTQVAPPLEEQVPILQQVPATLAHRVVTELHNPLP